MTLAQEMLELADRMQRCLRGEIAWPPVLSAHEFELAEIALREAALRLQGNVGERMV